MEKIENGDLVKDIITGYSGIVTGLAHYIAGCDQILVTEKGSTKKPGGSNSRWFDIERIKIKKKKAVTIHSRPTGGPANPSEQAPIR